MKTRSRSSEKSRKPPRRRVSLSKIISSSPGVVKLRAISPPPKKGGVDPSSATGSLGDQASREGFVMGPNGEEISEYEYRRHLNVRRNLLHLKKLGLVTVTPDHPRKRQPISSASQHKHKRTRTVILPSRRSSRLTGLPVSPDSNRSNRNKIDSDSSSLLVPKKRSFRRVRVDHNNVRILTATERQTLLPVRHWIEDMERYMRHVLHNSHQNVRNTIKTVTLLSNGDGVRHRKSKEQGNVFKHGVKISITDNLAEIHLEASQWVHDHGGDVSNGWLVVHPLKKMILYQAARFERGRAFT